MAINSHIVDADQLRDLSGKSTGPAIMRWASELGIKVLHGAKGPWTTIEAVNDALGVSSGQTHKGLPQDLF
ncbi:MAG: hypothetical protein ABW154_07715 [Dyella sp.]